MAAGLPVVVTDVRGNHDLVEHGKNGFLVKVGDVHGLTEALVALARDGKLRRRMGEDGRARAKEYALERVLQEMGTIYGRYLTHDDEVNGG
ncbi:glycosyltransferase [Candidatus Bipolaricaulota bacterium]|nr:glycosyltransferase [Candidatus Bipolaricaulota bacterium]